MMINNRSLLVVGGLAAIAWLASNSLYVVDETQRAVKLRFGEIIEEDIQPGLHVKVPITQTIRTFDTRVLTLDTDPSRYLTLEQKAVIVDSYVQWQVINPTRYYEATSGDELQAVRLIQPRVDESLRNEFGRLNLQQIISEKRDDLMSGPTNDLNALMRDELGVAILDIRVKRIDLPQDVSSAVYDRMRSERERQAREWRAQGQEESERIRANADRRRDAARRGRCRGRGDLLRGLRQGRGVLQLLAQPRCLSPELPGRRQHAGAGPLQRLLPVPQEPDSGRRLTPSAGGSPPAGRGSTGLQTW